MNLYKISSVFNIFCIDKSSIILLVIFLLSALLLSSLLSPLYAFILFSSYILGRAVSFCLLNYQKNASNYIEQLIIYYKTCRSGALYSKSKRNICKDPTCRRHHAGNHSMPWKNVKISRELNDAIEKFYNRILSNLIVSWYEEFANNEDFLHELRYCIRHATAELIDRFLAIDYVDVLLKKIIPQAVRHVDDYFSINEIVQLKNADFKSTAAEYLGNKIHPAATNRKNELAYLQHLSHDLIKLLLPEDYSQCKNYSVLLREIISGWVLLPLIDTFADPNVINYLVITITNYKSSNSNKHSTGIETDHKQVEILNNFFQSKTLSSSSFALSLNKIRNNSQLSNIFMQFLETHQHRHLLQFCIDVDDFNVNLLNPDLSKTQMEALHLKAIELHKKYLTKSSCSFIDCPFSICYEYSRLIESINNVNKLSASQPLYQAYDFTINNLENIWLPQFFHSDECYNYICGSRVTAEYHKTSIKSKKCYEPSNISAVEKISSSIGKIRGVIKSMTPIEGTIDVLDDDMNECLDVSENLNIRDISSWKVTIPLYKVTVDNKVPLFCLEVIHQNVNDNKMNHWKVWRRDQDFFTLKAKLVEFHGESQICDSPLPLRKAGTPIELRISKYEEFIAKLLQKPTLRSSDLLYMFLTEEDFILAFDWLLKVTDSRPANKILKCVDAITCKCLAITSMSLTNQDTGNIYQSVTYKLRKERGQYLDGFITMFYNSVMKPKQDIDVAEEGAELNKNQIKSGSYPKTYHNSVYNDNFNVSLEQFSDSSISNRLTNLNHFSQCLFYLFKNIFKLSTPFLKIYVAICNISQQLIDYLIKLFISKKLKVVLSQTNLAHLMGLLEEKIFTLHTPLTQSEYIARKSKAFIDIQLCPVYLDGILGGGINKGMKTLVEILQNPCYNKQLAYQLLDTVLMEMFVELKNVEIK